MFVHTESQPGLLDLQVDSKIRLQAQVTDGDVRAGHTLQACILHVTVENTFRDKLKWSEVFYFNVSGMLKLHLQRLDTYHMR